MPSRPRCRPLRVFVLSLLLGFSWWVRPAARAEFLSPGWQQKRLPTLPAPARIPNWFDYRFDPRAELFEIYVPKSLRPGRPCGVLAWVNADDQLHGPRRFEALCEEFGLIAVSAANCGNNRPTDRRIGLLVSAVLELSCHQPIDRRRCVISGVSGGGRTAAIAGFVHPEVWAGAISWVGGRFYRNFPVSAGSRYPGTGIRTHANPQAVTEENVREAKIGTKFVLLTGPRDFNFDESQDLYRAFLGEGFQVRIISEPGLGHEVGSAATMRQALEFVLGPPRAVPRGQG